MQSAAEPEMPQEPESTALTVEEALALLRSAEAAHQSGRVTDARSSYERLLLSGLLGEWAHFFLGRIQRDESNYDAAMASFSSAIEADPTLFWAHYERLMLASDTGAQIDRLNDYVAELIGIAWLDIEPPHVRRLEPIAHSLWDSGHIEPATHLLAKLMPSPHVNQLSLVRIVESNRDPAVVSAAAKRLESFTELDDEALRVLADHHQQHGDLDGEIAILEKRRRTAPKDFQTWLSLARSYAKKGDRDRALATLEDGPDFPLRQRSFVELIAHLELGDIEIAFHAFRNHARLYGEVPKFPGIRLSYQLGDNFEIAKRNEVLGLLISTFEADSDVALVRVNAAIRDQRWEDARTLFTTHFADVENKPQSVRLTQIDILAFSGRLEEAMTLLDRERIDGAVPPAFLRSTMRILSELDRWADVFDVGIANLEADTSFEHFLSVMVRASRKANRGEDLLTALLALPQPLKRSQLEALVAVMEDLAELGHADVLDRIGELQIPRNREHRIRLKLRAAKGLVAVAKDLCIYYCADKNYLLPALVSLTALAMSNVSIARRAVFHLVVDSDAVPIAREAGGAIANRLGLSLEVVDASTIVSSADRLRTSYGIFTGGQQLALAAYYRIFFARHLVDQGKYDQALYIDADTVVRSGLEELFATERATPLMARYEIDRPEVRHATEVHQLKGRYFNSGVLSFDLKHPLLPELLDRAIAAAIDPEVNLIFQDQCALNIGFDCNLSELPERYNYFNPPTVSGDGISATDAVIVHFLDRPKPWDSLYRQRAREWFEWFDLVESLRQADVAAI